jgi:hypothetical protein
MFFPTLPITFISYYGFPSALTLFGMELLTQYSLGLEQKECVRTNNNEVLGSAMKTNHLKTIANCEPQVITANDLDQTVIALTVTENSKKKLSSMYFVLPGSVKTQSMFATRNSVTVIRAAVSHIQRKGKLQVTSFPGINVLSTVQSSSASSMGSLLTKICAHRDYSNSDSNFNYLFN